MKVSAKEEFRDLASKNGWSPAFAEGYVDGRAARTHGSLTPKVPLIDTDQYALGFLAGYSLTRQSRCRAAVSWSGTEGSTN